MWIKFFFDDVVYHYLSLTKGTQFEAPLDNYRLNEGFYFLGKKTERGTISVRHRNFPNIFIGVGKGMPIDFPTGVQRGFFYVHSQVGDCVLYRMTENPSHVFATFEDVILIDAEINDADRFDLESLCRVISKKH